MGTTCKRGYATAWVGLFGLSLLVSIAGDTTQATSIIDNTVCLNLITFLLVTLLPARDIVERISAVPDVLKKPQRKDE